MGSKKFLLFVMAICVVGLGSIFAIKQNRLKQNSNKYNITILEPIKAAKNENKFTYNPYNSEDWQNGKIKFQIDGEGMESVEFKIDAMEILEAHNLIPLKTYESGQNELNANCKKITNSPTSMQYECDFRPIAKKFNFKVSVINASTNAQESQTIEFDLIAPTLTNENKISRNEEYTEAMGPVGGCGNWKKATTHQRIFDCSMKVLDHAGRVNYFRHSHASDRMAFHFEKWPEGIEDYWFLVSCPENQLAYQCAWLSPELKKENIALGGNEFLSFPPDLLNGLPREWWMEYYANDNPASQHRILWSGMISSQPYKFWDVNTHVGYEYGNDLQIHENWFPRFESLNFGGKSATYTDICQTNYNLYKENKNNVDPFIWLDKEVYDWRVPSYPQIMTLTGYPMCNGGQYIADGQYKNRLEHEWIQSRCLDVDNVDGPQWGFSASFVPGFYRSVGEKAYRYLWSSGAHTAPAPNPFTKNYHGWAFDSLKGLVNSWDRDDKHGVRCATMNW